MEKGISIGAIARFHKHPMSHGETENPSSSRRSTVSAWSFEVDDLQEDLLEPNPLKQMDRIEWTAIKCSPVYPRKSRKSHLRSFWEKETDLETPLFFKPLKRPSEQNDRLPPLDGGLR
jgi:hypothetical protein